MKFVFLTCSEVEGATIHWSMTAEKSHQLVAAALAAGFTDTEIQESPTGVLELDWAVSQEYVFKAGAYALIGMNGSTLIELPSSRNE